MSVNSMNTTTLLSNLRGLAAMIQYLARFAKAAGSTSVSLANIVAPFLFVVTLLVASAGSGSVLLLVGLGMHFTVALASGVCLYLLNLRRTPLLLIRIGGPNE